MYTCYIDTRYDRYYGYPRFHEIRRENAAGPSKPPAVIGHRRSAWYRIIKFLAVFLYSESQFDS